MHYHDGTEAKLGDVVKGIGCNVQGVIVGTVVHLTPGTSVCNIQVAHPVVQRYSPSLLHPNFDVFPPDPRLHTMTDADGVCGTVRLNIEYGQCDAFELVHRPE